MIFQNLGQPMNPQTAIQQIQQNPAAMLKKVGLTIPEGMSNPQQIIQHLINSGQVSNGRIQMLQQMLGRRG